MGTTGQNGHGRTPRSRRSGARTVAAGFAALLLAIALGRTGADAQIITTTTTTSGEPTTSTSEAETTTTTSGPVLTTSTTAPEETTTTTEAEVTTTSTSTAESTTSSAPATRPTTTAPRPTSSTFVPPSGVSSTTAPPAEEALDADTGKLPLFVTLSLLGFTIAIAILTVQWIRSRPRRPGTTSAPAP